MWLRAPKVQKRGHGCTWLLLGAIGSLVKLSTRNVSRPEPRERVHVSSSQGSPSSGLRDPVPVSASDFRRSGLSAQMPEGVLPSGDVARQIEQLQYQDSLAVAELRQLEDRAASLGRQVREVRRRLWLNSALLAWMRLACFTRARSQQWLGTRAAGACLFVGLCCVTALLLTGSLVAAVVSLPLALVLATSLLYWPADAQLGQMIDNRRAVVDGSTALYGRLANELRQARQQVQETASRRRELRTALQKYVQTREFQALQLLNMGWRDLRGYDFERFLAEVFRLHGMRVTLTGGSGDQGVDLIVEYDGSKVAIQAKGYEQAVSNNAVQEVFAGQRIHGCTACMVITNSRFTSGARQAAASLGCGLVDGDLLPDLVLGRRSLGDFLPRHV